MVTSTRVTPEQPKAAVLERVAKALREGVTTLGAERDKLGLKSNSPLRKGLIALLGREGYQTMMAENRKARADNQGG
jgi:hypothetical protein